MGKDAEMFLPPAGLKKKEATEPLPMEVDAYERFRTEFRLPFWWPVRHKADHGTTGLLQDKGYVTAGWCRSRCQAAAPPRPAAQMVKSFSTGRERALAISSKW